jgi:hypothetical protein
MQRDAKLFILVNYQTYPKYYACKIAEILVGSCFCSFMTYFYIKMNVPVTSILIIFYLHIFL